MQKFSSHHEVRGILRGIVLFRGEIESLFLVICHQQRKRVSIFALTRRGALRPIPDIAGAPYGHQSQAARPGVAIMPPTDSAWRAFQSGAIRVPWHHLHMLATGGA